MLSSWSTFASKMRWVYSFHCCTASMIQCPPSACIILLYFVDIQLYCILFYSLKNLLIYDKECLVNYFLAFPNSIAIRSRNIECYHPGTPVRNLPCIVLCGDAPWDENRLWSPLVRPCCRHLNYIYIYNSLLPHY